MSIGRTFPESLQKGMRSLENGRLGLNADPPEVALEDLDDDHLLAAVAKPTPSRLFQVEALLRRGVDLARVHEATGIDEWFLDQILAICEERVELEGVAPELERQLGASLLSRRGTLVALSFSLRPPITTRPGRTRTRSAPLTARR